MSNKENQQQDKIGGLGSLLDRSPTGRTKAPRPGKPAKPTSFAMTIQPETRKLFDEIQWLREFAIDFKRTTRDDVLAEALKSYAKDIGYDKLMKKYQKDMPEDISPGSGRPRKR